MQIGKVAVNDALDLEQLSAELDEILTPEVAHRLERLVHTHIGGPLTTVSTQLEIMNILAKRDPDKLPEEIEALREHMKEAAYNVRTIVRALAVAAKSED